MATIARREISFDHHGKDYLDNWQRKAAELHAGGYPLAWSAEHGGYWVQASWQDVRAGLDDWQTFSSDNDIENVRGGGRGVTVPRQPYSLVLNESDPPVHTARRRAEMPFFLPKMLQHWREVARSHLEDAIRTAQAKARINLVRDIVIPTAARTTLQLVGFDMDNWEEMALSAHEAGFITPGAPGYPFEQMAQLRVAFRDMLADRRVNPRDDLVTALTKAKIQDRPLNDDEGESMMSALVFGGFDTTTSCASHAMIWLDRNRGMHRRLVEDDAFTTNAIEEFLRYVSPASGIARTATRSVELGGQRINAGDPVYFWLAGANRDPVKFPDPDRVWLERPNAKDHVAFSAGVHRCLGAPLAKIELKLILTSLLERFPNFRIDHDAIVPYPSLKSTNGLIDVPIELEPRGRIG
jgi:cytochrome P450